MSEIETGYQMVKECHIWWLRGPNGGVHVWAQKTSDEFQSKFGKHYQGGIECHSPKPLYGSQDNDPHHEHCWVLKGPCWHDGSSLQFAEGIEPFMRHANDVRSMDDFIFSVCLDRYRLWFGEDEDAT